MSDKPENPPIVFISYSHDTKPHKEWVAGLAQMLLQNGVEVLFDQFDLGPGDDVPKFMEHAVSTADYVLMICTEPYVRKVNDGKGGAGYEAMIVTGELVTNLGTNKFIPIIRQSGEGKEQPRCISTRFHVDLSEDANTNEELEKLLKAIHRVPQTRKVPLGKNPFSEKAFEGKQEMALKAERRLEFSNVFALPEATYNRAIDIIHAKDHLAWRRLMLAAEDYSTNALCQWKTNEPKIPESNRKDFMEFLDFTREGVAKYAPLMVCLLAASESGDKDYAGQLGWTDSILSRKWEYAQNVYWAEFPATIFFVTQALVGAMLMAVGSVQAVQNLAMTKLPDSPSSFQPERLFKQKRLIGWPDSLHHDCSVAWTFLNTIIENWSWVQHAFGSAERCKEAVISYYFLLNIHNFLWRLKSPTTWDMIEITTPLYFLG